MKGSKTMRYSVSDTSQLYNAFNTVTKRYPNGDVSIKKLKFTAFKRKDGWELTDHDFVFWAKEREAHTIGERIYGKWLWNYKCSIMPKIDTDIDIETLETKYKNIVKQPLENENYEHTLADIEAREKYLNKKAMDNIVKTRSKIYDIARANEWNYFITLTFNKRKADRYDYGECVKKISKFMRNFKLRNKVNCPNFRYLIIHEKHEDGAYHWHGLIYLEDEMLLKKAVYPLGHKRGGKPILKKGKQVYNWSKYNHGYSTVTKIQNLEATCKYILKYVTKDLNKSYTKGRRRFMYSSNCLKPEIVEHTSSDDDYVGLKPIYDSQFSTGYAYNQADVLADLFGDEVTFIDD